MAPLNFTDFMIDNPLPTRVTPRNERDELMLEKSNTDKADPSLAKDRRDNVDPIEQKSLTVRDCPMRRILRVDKVLLRVRQSAKDTLPPCCPRLRSERELPMVEKLRTEPEFPMRVQLRMLMLLPCAA